MSGDVAGAPDNPGVIAPPPLIYAGALPRGLSRVLGWLLIVGGVVIGSLGFRAMRRAGTNVDPREPTTAIVVEGPYCFTRNPLYLSMTFSTAAASPLVLTHSPPSCCSPPCSS